MYIIIVFYFAWVSLIFISIQRVKLYRVLDYFWKVRTQFEVFMIIFFKADTKNSDLHDMF